MIHLDERGFFVEGWILNVHISLMVHHREPLVKRHVVHVLAWMVRCPSHLNEPLPPHIVVGAEDLGRILLVTKLLIIPSDHLLLRLLGEAKVGLAKLRFVLVVSG